MHVEAEPKERHAVGVSAALVSQGFVAGSSLVLQWLALAELGTAGLGTFAILTAGIVITATAVFTGWVGDPLVLLDRHDPGIRRALARLFVGFVAGSSVVGAVLALIVGHADIATAAVFGLALAAWLAEEAARRLMMATQRFVSLAVNDAVYAVVAVGVALVVLVAADLTLRWLLAAMLLGSIASIVVALRQIPALELARPEAGPASMREVAAVATWRSGQLMLRPASMLLARVAVASIVSTSALGVIEAGRLLVAPVITAANGFGGFTLPLFSRRRERLRFALVMKMAVVSGVAAMVMTPFAFLAEPLFSRWSNVESISAVLVLSWCFYGVMYAANIPVVNALTALGHSRTVFWGRLVDGVLTVGLSVLVALAGAEHLMPLVMSLGIVIGTVMPVYVLGRRGYVPEPSWWPSVLAGRKLTSTTIRRTGRFRPAAAATIGVVLVVATDYEWRLRDLSGSLSGSVDLAILIELAAYGAVAAYLAVFVCGLPRIRRTTSTQFFMVGWVVFTATSALWSVYPRLAVVRGAQLLVIAAFAAALATRGSTAHLRAFAHAFLALSAASVLVGLVWRVQYSELQANRFNWMAVHPVLAGLILGTALMIGMHFWVRPARSDGALWPRWRYAASTLLCAAGLLGTQTRGSIAAAVVGVMLVISMASRPRDRIVLALVGVIGLAGVVAAFAGDISSYLLRGENPESIGTLNSRLPLWELAVELAWQRPLGGWGLGSSRGLFYEEIGLGGAHNAYVNVLVDVGFVGFFLWAGMIVSLWTAVMRLRRSGNRDASLLLVVLVYHLINALTTEGLGAASGTATVWLLMMVAWVGAAQREALAAVRARRDDRWLLAAPRPTRPAPLVST